FAPRLVAIDRARRFLVVVSHAFARAEHGALTAGHDRLHQIRTGADRGRHFGRLQHAEPPARAGADEDHAAAFAHRVRDDLDADGDALLFTLTGREHLAILVQHVFDDVSRGTRVDSECRRIDLL